MERWRGGESRGGEGGGRVVAGERSGRRQGGVGGLSGVSRGQSGGVGRLLTTRPRTTAVQAAWSHAMQGLELESCRVRRGRGRTCSRSCSESPLGQGGVGVGGRKKVGALGGPGGGTGGYRAKGSTGRLADGVYNLCERLQAWRAERRDRSRGELREYGAGAKLPRGVAVLFTPRTPALHPLYS